MNELAQTVAENLFRDDPEIEARIEAGITANRKGFGRFVLTRPDNQPVSRATITYRQVRHEYRFGCNAFMLGQFTEAEKNAAYEARFASLFNLAVVPFYWAALEPLEGQPRFRSDSPPIYRRPPPDTVLDFCETHAIVPKGHLLFWHTMLPDWLPQERLAISRCLERRIREIAERYAARIPIWDVANEAMQWNPIQGRTLPDDHVETAFRLAGRYFPETTELLYNDGTQESWGWYHGAYTPLYLLARHLLDAGLPLRGLGLQCHMFRNPAASANGWGGTHLDPRFIFAHLDLYARLRVPLNISEITITAHHDLGDGDAFQQRVAERLYRLWFSHAATNGIIWWNLVDGTAAFAPQNSDLGENQYRGGLLNYDLTPKPAFLALQRLIREEWNSVGTLDYVDGAPNQFHGFFGDYEITAKTDHGTFEHRIRLASDAKNTFNLKLG